MTNPITELGGEILAFLNWGDITPYFTQVTIPAFLIVVSLTILFALSKPERQIELIFGKDDHKEAEIVGKELRFRRFMSIICGIATAWAMITGDIFNYTLSLALIGITNIGIVASVEKGHVLEAAFQYGLMIMLASIPLFGSAALVLGTTGTLSMHLLAQISVGGFAPLMLMMGVVGEVGIAPFYAAKAELFRAPGAPYIIMIHVSSLMVIVRSVEVLLILIGGG
ncbi:hypothetical protein AKJ65_02635 [candidate division MSBL1 archaeon SCGC-AAA259E19]|uniref:NADH:quinone oxidoreductase/Mrp antiporter membrane subunit domain-containing protein n=1 Tax=candidate division MSBL1 archaeon SCGC-AAA259E19 TaxID=1698264 RepID=A0A133ULN7_9EURY|nr:hypothetical protein AKJ65_02635 [candidate division MSBL1 archaeon SCGC-AAA259E19]